MADHHRRHPAGPISDRPTHRHRPHPGHRRTVLPSTQPAPASLTQTQATSILNNAPRWSHPPGKRHSRHSDGMIAGSPVGFGAVVQGQAGARTMTPISRRLGRRSARLAPPRWVLRMPRHCKRAASAGSVSVTPRHRSRHTSAVTCRPMRIRSRRTRGCWAARPQRYGQHRPS